MSEVLYTQEDIDEWIRTCEELQERNRELKQELDEKNLYEERQHSLIDNLRDDIAELNGKVASLTCENNRLKHYDEQRDELLHAKLQDKAFREGECTTAKECISIIDENFELCIQCTTSLLADHASVKITKSALKGMYNMMKNTIAKRFKLEEGLSIK